MLSLHEKFNAHLDVCEQCREHPWQLCEVGHKLIVEACSQLHVDAETFKMVSSEGTPDAAAH